MNLKTIIKKLTETPEKFDKLEIEIQRNGETGVLTYECSNDYSFVWRTRMSVQKNG